ncbi:MAG TPA: outer membrane beta-barrel protein [Vicinamibacterales bacterium]|nr:outer membrane beta-barrel protein [Vicinamibacterales bacterium]
MRRRFVYVLVAVTLSANGAAAQEGTPAPGGHAQTETSTDAAPARPAASRPASGQAATSQSAGQAAQEPEKKPEPFAFADFTWLTGNPRTKESPIDTKVFTGEFRVDDSFTDSFNHPQDDTIVGSSEVFRSGENQVTQLGIGGDFHYDNVIGRLMTQFGMYAQTTPRNDASPARGQWALDTAYRYISEAYGGYHFDKMNGINVEAGIFMSYIGLDSYYQFDNWTYQPSYVSSNTPWFFNGMRVQIFPSDKLKIEPWLINGWQSYGRFNTAPGIGGQVLWRPNGSVSILANNYWGADTLGIPDRKRIHTDDSIQWKYYDRPDAGIDKAAMTFTFDAGCEFGGGVRCGGGDAATPSQYFIGFMTYQRFWFHRDLFAATIGGGAINNPGRYLVLLPPINGANAASGTPYFTGNPGDPFKAWDMQLTFDYMPSQFITFRSEFNHRASNVPYFAGAGGVTPPGGNTGAPGSLVPGWAPDLAKSENRITFALLVKL